MATPPLELTISVKADNSLLMTALASTAFAPQEDLSIVDARAPRANQTVVAVGATVAVLTGAWPILTLLGAQLLVSVVFGRRYCLPCVAYFKFLQPRLGPGPVEDSRAPRFANQIGSVFLLGATAAYAAGFAAVGAGLGATVAVLATLAATTGLCVGCEAYRILARLRGIRGGRVEHVDLDALGGAVSDGTVVLFTHPLCSDCQTLGRTLEARGTPVVKVDVSKQRPLAKKYGVAVVPFAVRVDASGRVLGNVH
jgi:hypothetical protein